MRSTLLSTAMLAAACIAAPVNAQQGVDALLKQGQYWQSKGRNDLANQAYRRVLAIDPKNATARAALSRQPAKPAAPAPAAAPKPAPQAAAPRTTTARPTTTTRPATTAKPAPVRAAAPVDRGGDARAAGFKALDAGNLAEASRQFQTAISRNRNDLDALGGLGLVRLRGGQFSEASGLLQRASAGGNGAKWATALASARFYGGIDEANAAADAGRVEEAQRIAEGLIASNFQDKSAAYDLLGGIYERQGRYGEAARLYEQAGTGAAKPDTALQARLIRAQALEASAAGDNVAAGQLFQRGIMADPEDPWIRYEYGRYLDRQGRRADVDGIIGGLRSSAKPEALYAAALLSNQTGRPGDAETLIGQIPLSQQTPEMRTLALNARADASVGRARAMAAQGQAPQAAAALRQLAESPGLSVSSRGIVAQALYDLGDEAGAARVAQQALSESSDDPQSYESLVRIFARTGQDSFALSAIQRASQQAGGTADGQRAVARLNGILAASQADRMRDAGQYASAFDLLQAQWNASPGNMDVLSALARLYQSGGMNAQAAQTFQLVLNQSPSDKGALMGLMDTASAMRDFDRARMAADRAIALNPTDYNVFMAAARMEKARGDSSAAARNLRRARDLYLGQTTMVTGGFSANNPFSDRQASPFQQAPQQINPFNLGSSNQPAPVQNGYGTPLPAGYPAAQPGYAMPQALPGQAGYPATGTLPAMPGYAAAPTGYAAAPAGYPGTPAYPAQSGYPMQGQMGGPAAAPITDPVLAAIDRDMRDLSTETAPRIDVNTGYRERSGETGLSALKELSGEVTASTGLFGGRIWGKATAVVLDSGQPSGSGLARFGRNATPEAQGIVAQLPSELVNAKTQNASGVALSVGYQHGIIQADVGVTPLGFEETHLTGGVSLSPRLSRYTTARVWAERRAVTDSVIAYSGTVDPVSGGVWGAVTKNGGGVSFSYDKEGSGVYADGSFHHYDGFLTPNNNAIQVNVGGYLRVFKDRQSTLTAGVNANYQRYDNNQNYFTYGHGGYFSPQNFFSVSFPVRYQRRTDLLDLEASVVPGYQSYSQDEAPIYPTDAVAQAALEALKLRNDDVRASYDSISKTGFGLAAGLSAYYRVSDSTRVGGEVNYNTFGQYNEFKSMLGIRQTIGGSN